MSGPTSQPRRKRDPHPGRQQPAEVATDGSVFTHPPANTYAREASPFGTVIQPASIRRI